MRNRLLALVIFLCVSHMPLQAVAAEAVGQVVTVIGLVERLAVDGSRAALKGSDAIYLGDRLLSAADGRAKLMLRDDSILKLSPSSELAINEQLLGPSGESRTGLGLMKGRVRALLGRKLGAASRFEIHTAVAVAGVRGTDFEVWSNGETIVRCYEGKVAVRNIDELLEQEVILGPGMFTNVLEGVAPSAPQPFSPSAPIALLGGSENESAEEDELFEAQELSLPDVEPTGTLSDIGSSELTPRVGFEPIIQGTLYGNVNQQQQSTVSRPLGGAVGLPFNISVPRP